jgi:aerobic C4-dicarboxylate transport protein
MIFKKLHVQVLCAIAIGAALGYLQPDVAQQMKPLGDLFVKLIKMMIAPIIFATVVVGLAKMGSMTEVGRVGFKALLYFETATSVALVLGLVVVNLWKPGAGLNIDPATLDAKSIAPSVILGIRNEQCALVPSESARWAHASRQAWFA